MYRAIFDARSEAHELKGCIKNFSIVKLYDKVIIKYVLIIRNMLLIYERLHVISSKVNTKSVVEVTPFH